MDSKISFIKCLALMTASLAGVDMPAMRSSFSTMLKNADHFLREHRIYRSFTKYAKEFIESGLEMEESLAEAMEAELRPYLPALNENLDITRAELALIKDCLLYMRRDSEPALKRVARNISSLGDTSINRLFLFHPQGEETEVAADDKTTKAMAKIVEKYTGEKGDPVLTLAEMRELAEDDPRAAEKYKELRKVFVANYKQSLLHFVRSSGKQVVDVKVARKYLEAKGCNYIPKGFVGGIDEVGKLYTVEGKQISGMLIGEVAMNPKYNPKTDDTYVCFLVSNPGQTLRTFDFTKGNRGARFNKVQDFIKNLETFRRKWLADLKSSDEKTQILAAMVETLHQTQARIGGDSTNKEGEDRFGLSTLLASHAKMTAGGFEFHYVGKKSTMQHHVLKADSPSNKRIIAIIKKCLEGKGRNDLLFTYRGRHVDGAQVNRYLKSIGVPAGITAHKFRHLAGTKMAQEILAGAPFNVRDKGYSQASVEKWLKEAMKPVGAMLHHRTGTGENEKVTGMVAINAYISPDVLKDFFGKLKLRVPDWVPKT